MRYISLDSPKTSFYYNMDAKLLALCILDMAQKLEIKKLQEIACFQKDDANTGCA